MVNFERSLDEYVSEGRTILARVSDFNRLFRPPVYRIVGCNEGWQNRIFDPISLLSQRCVYSGDRVT